jgi:hypothetical protein
MIQVDPIGIYLPENLQVALMQQILRYTLVFANFICAVQFFVLVCCFCFFTILLQLIKFDQYTVEKESQVIGLCIDAASTKKAN